MHRFTRDHGPTVLGWCIRLTGPKVDPVTVAREILDEALGGLDRAPGAVPVRTWLFSRVLARVAREDRPRRWWRRRSRLPDQAGVRPRVRAALQRLPLEQRAALVLVDLEGLRLEAAATVAGRPVGELARQLSLARSAFAEACRDEGLTHDALEGRK